MITSFTSTNSVTSLIWRLIVEASSMKITALRGRKLGNLIYREIELNMESVLYWIYTLNKGFNVGVIHFEYSKWYVPIV